jgi:sugar phosphate isomerase/epimerase
LDELSLVAILKDVPTSWPIIVHPDLIQNPSHWRFFGSRLCLENMDQRKLVGRTVAEMESMFQQLPDASFCFDIGHARQVDPTMGVAVGMLRRFRGRLRQIHMSEVDPQGRHIPIGFAALHAFQKVANLIPEGCPVILESMVDSARAQSEIEVAIQALSTNPLSSPREAQASL